MINKKVIAIDFDGTIVNDKYPEIGELKKGAKETINELQECNVVILWTCRSGRMLKEAEQFLIKNEINYDYINENCVYLKDKYKTDPRKIGADIYIDDKNIFGFPGWEAVRKL